jgi:hypothetical protein
MSIIKELEGKFIYYDGKYWLVEKFDPELYEGGFFAVPVYFDENQQAEVRHASSNWCYKCNGAFLKDPERNVMIEAYKSQIKYLEWQKGVHKESLFEKKENYQDYLLKMNTKIDFYIKLLKEVVKDE